MNEWINEDSLQKFAVALEIYQICFKKGQLMANMDISNNINNKFARKFKTSLKYPYCYIIMHLIN